MASKWAIHVTHMVFAQQMQVVCSTKFALSFSKLCLSELCRNMRKLLQKDRSLPDKNLTFYVALYVNNEWKFE